MSEVTKVEKICQNKAAVLWKKLSGTSSLLLEYEGNKGALTLDIVWWVLAVKV